MRGTAASGEAGGTGGSMASEVEGYLAELQRVQDALDAAVQRLDAAKCAGDLARLRVALVEVNEASNRLSELFANPP